MRVFCINSFRLFSTLDARDALSGFQNEYASAKGVDQQLSAVNKVNIS